MGRGRQKGCRGSDWEERRKVKLQSRYNIERRKIERERRERERVFFQSFKIIKLKAKNRASQIVQHVNALSV